MQQQDETIPDLQRQVHEQLTYLRANPLIARILDRLREDLPPDLHYHCAAHTDDVLEETVLFSVVGGLSNYEIELLAIAAAFHDAGFIQSPVDNEAIGADMAREAMQETGTFSNSEIESVTSMILDTRMQDSPNGPQQKPSSELSKYLLDADLSNLGREDFFDKLELQRRELGYDRNFFVEQAFQLVHAHRWHTHAARRLRQGTKEQNIAKLCKLVSRLQASDDQVRALGISIERLGFLAKLPLLLTSSLDPQKVVSLALEHLRANLAASAATVFLLDQKSGQLTFWALHGSEGKRLEGQRMPGSKGIVGWVLDKQEPVLVNDVSRDPRFFSVIDKEGDFQTRNMLCVPLTIKGQKPLGAVQVLNSTSQEFTSGDLLFLEQFAGQVALALDNARLHDALQERNMQLETLEKRKNEMISVIGHEFKTPLNVIQTSAELLSSGTLPPEENAHMGETLIAGVQRLARLINQVKNLSLISTDKPELHKETIAVNSFLEGCVHHFEGIATKRSLNLKCELYRDELYVNGDRALLEMALMNIIANAIRFTQSGGSITVRTDLRSGLVCLEVQDTGMGIPEKELPLIFEKFYEVKSSLEHMSGEYEYGSAGLGLGLSTTQAILKGHGSAIEVASTPGRGSTFGFRLEAVMPEA
jgi:signal transduction histidine kinase/predicted metal-dependent HD superfamily phosphohydrolase